MGKNVHIIPHMHWDREWYFTTEESRILLVNNMEEIMEMLEDNSSYPYYVMDGQTAILEDYFAVKPENRERVKKLVQSGKLIIGPWYTQTDEMVVGGESIVRNLLYGLKDCKEFGEPMMIGYLPDSFGQSEKLPQILNGFGMDRCIFWRGASERHGTNKHNFYWESNSSGKVLVHLLPLGYAIGKYLPQDKDALSKRMDKYLPVLKKGSINQAITLPNGHDQMPVQKDIFEVIEKLEELYPDDNFFLSKYENVFEELEKENNIDTIKGELLDGKYMRVHRSIFSTRADLKSSNTRIENKITNILEPLATVAYSLGINYEEGLIEAIWKEIMKNHAHDSIGCCCSDKVHKAIENRFFLAEDKTDELIKFYKRKVVDAISCDIALDKLVVFNLLPYEKEQVVEAQVITKMKNFILTDKNGVSYDFEVLEKEEIDAGLIDRQIVHYGNYDPFVKYVLLLKDVLPPMGYKTYLIKETDGISQKSIVENRVQTMQNDYYSIDINSNGTLTVTDKKTSTIYKDVLLVEDGSDDGDEYDYSPLAEDFVVTSKDVKAQITMNKYKNKTDSTIKFTLEVPKDLDSRKNKVCDSKIEVSFDITMKSNSDILEITANINNFANDHRVRVLIPSQIGAKSSISDNQFGEIQRPVVDSAIKVWEKENWDERPDSIYPMLSYVGLGNKQGLAVLTNSVREFEIIGNDFDTVAITLFRSVGFLGKEEMFRRPGRPSGIKLATPDSQMIGAQQYAFALVPNNEKLSIKAKEYITPVQTYNKMPYNAMKLNAPTYWAPYKYSLLKDTKENFVISAFKKTQGKDGIVLRCYQSVNDVVNTNIDALQGFKINSEINLNEDFISNVNNTISLPKNVVKTYLIKKQIK